MKRRKVISTTPSIPTPHFILSPIALNYLQSADILHHSLEPLALDSHDENGADNLGFSVAGLPIEVFTYTCFTTIYAYYLRYWNIYSLFSPPILLERE